VLLFDIVGGGQNLISGERAKILARIIGISEKVVDEAADEICHCSQSKPITYDAF